jgi:hypothetical protein
MIKQNIMKLKTGKGKLLKLETVYVMDKNEENFDIIHYFSHMLSYAQKLCTNDS